MHILGICASGRKNGNSKLLLDLALTGAREAGATVQAINLTDYKIKSCTGCMNCILNERDCHLQDDMPIILDYLKKAEGLILAAPTYVLGPAGVSKLLLDRFFMAARQVNDKDYNGVAATITTAGLPDWNPMGEIINIIPLTHQFKLVDYLVAYGPGPGEPLLDDKIADHAKELGKRVVNVWQGKAEKRAPEKNQCPHCYSKVYNLKQGGKAACSICGSEAKVAVDPLGEWELKFEPGWEEQNRFSPANLSRHIFEWIIGSKDRYLAKLPEIMAKGILPAKRG